jgi:hypothetical protein
MRNVLVCLTCFAAGLSIPPALAQQQMCFDKSRHIACHFADGKDVVYDTAPHGTFFTVPPAMTFMTADGLLHAIVGNCEVTCRP